MATLVGFAMDDPIASLHAKHARSAQPESKQVCVVAEAIAEILRQENIAPSPTAVFAAVMSSLERAETSASPEVSTAMLVVLATALEHAPAGPVLTKLPDCVKVLLASGRAFQEHPPALRGVVQCIGLLVAALRDAPPPANDGADGDWSHLQKAFSAVCNLCVDSRPKVRKQAAASAEAALRALRGTPYASHASACFAKVAVATARAPAKAARDLAEMHGSAGAKAAERRAQAAATECLHLLGALKRTLRELEEPAAGETASAVAALLSLGEPLLTQHACDALMSLFAQTGAGAAAAAAALAASARTFGKGSNDAAAAPSASEACRLAAKTAAAAIAPLASAAHAEAARRPTLAVSLVRAHAAAVRRLHELDPAGAGGGALPAAAHELVKMLNSVHEGVAMEAGACLSSLVTRCVDANMVREGIKAMATARAAGQAAPTRPPPVVGVANALRASLGFRYRAAWPIALPVVAAAFDRLGPAAGPILGGCLEALGEMGAHGEGLQCRGQLTLCLSAAVKALGPEQVLSVLPLRLEEGVDAEIAAIRNGRSNGFDRDGDDAMETDAPGAELDENGGNVAGAAGARLWLVPLLRQALRGCRVGYFTEEMLPIARRLGKRAVEAKAAGRAFEAQRCAAGESALWSLLPAFCRWPEDAAESFPGLAPALGNALSSRADLRGPLTEALRRLIQQARAAINADVKAKANADAGADSDGEEDEEDEDDEDEEDEDRAREAAAAAAILEDRPDWFSTEIAEAQAAAVAKYARNFLPILFNLFVAAPPERRGELSATVGCFAQVTDATSLGGFFRTVLKKLVKVTSDAENAPDALTEGGATKSARRCTFMDLSLAMVPGLDAPARDLVFKAARPATGEKDAAVQKRAYKLLAALMKSSTHTEWLANNADAAEEALVEGAGSCAPAARRYRLRCVAALLPSLMEREAKAEEDAAAVNAAGDDAAATRSAAAGSGSFTVLLSELIVATKETNARTRQQAFKLLVDIPRGMERRAGRANGGGRITGGAGGGGGMLGAWLAAGDDDDDDDEEENENENENDARHRDDSEDDDMEHAQASEEMGSGVRKFFMTVLAGVVGASPTMQSAAVMALARLLYEFSAQLVSTVPELLPAVFALMQGGHREVVKAALGFIKVAAVRLPQVELANQLADMVPALLACNDDEDGYNRFRGKVKVVVERLVKRCGYGAVEAVTPQAHIALLSHMKKEEFRNEKRRKASIAGSEMGGGGKSIAGKSAKTGRRSAWNDAEVFSDDDENGGGGMSRFGGTRGGLGARSMAPTSRREAGGGGPRSAAEAHALRAAGGARLPGAKSGSEPLDLLDESAVRRHMLKQGDRRGGDEEIEGGYSRGEGGKLVITEEKEYGKRKRDDDDGDDDGRTVRSVGARSNVSRRTAKTEGGISLRSTRTQRTARTSRTDARSSKTTRPGKTEKKHGVHTADVYRAKKGATGDAFTKERTLEPYAYWPLDAKLMNRRAHKRRSASEKLGQVVTKAKGSGIHHGQKAKDAKRRKK